MSDIFEGEPQEGTGPGGNIMARYSPETNSWRDVTSEWSGAGASLRNGWWGWGLQLYDSDLDGDLDIAMVNGANMSMPASPHEVKWFWHDPMRYWRHDTTCTNTAGGSDAECSLYHPTGSPTGNGDHCSCWTWMAETAADEGLTFTEVSVSLVTWDYDLDGDLDLALANMGEEPPAFYRNEVLGPDDAATVAAAALPGATADDKAAADATAAWLKVTLTNTDKITASAYVTHCPRAYQLST